jgi:hypothetical protein
MEKWEYGDPEKVAIRRQEEFNKKERACGQCVHRFSIEIKGKRINGCEFKRREYGVRCGLYRVKPNDQAKK